MTAASKGGKIIGNRFSQQADTENTLYMSSVDKINRADDLIFTENIYLFTLPGDVNHNLYTL